MTKFSFTNSKPPIDFFAQNSLRFGRRAKRGEPTKFDFSLLVRREGFEPSEPFRAMDLQSIAIVHSATCACMLQNIV